MAASCRNYAAYRRGPQRAWLGRFVVPASRLEEFENAAAAADGDSARPEPWRLSALIGANLAEDLERVAAFNSRHARPESTPFLVDALEIKAGRGEEILEAAIWIPDSLIAYFEIPIRENPSGPLAAIARAGARAKVRTGGVTPDAFPTASELARFLKQCVQAGVAFKATAGLHHPLRSMNRLTYEAEAPQAMMFGFLNLFLAAAFAHMGLDASQLESLLEERSPQAFSFHENGANWDRQTLNLAQLRAARGGLSISFGSCSFEEPVNDLKQLGLL
jgi:hypothetical protein